MVTPVVFDTIVTNKPQVLHHRKLRTIIVLAESSFHYHEEHFHFNHPFVVAVASRVDSKIEMLRNIILLTLNIEFLKNTFLVLLGKLRPRDGQVRHTKIPRTEIVRPIITKIDSNNTKTTPRHVRIRRRFFLWNHGHYATR
jgi:hypothetical protein